MTRKNGTEDHKVVVKVFHKKEDAEKCFLENNNWRIGKRAFCEKLDDDWMVTIYNNNE